MRDAMTERFENLFARLAQRREGAFVPFVNLCDPDPETSLAVLETLVASGARRARARDPRSPTRAPTAPSSRPPPTGPSPTAPRPHAASTYCAGSGPHIPRRPSASCSTSTSSRPPASGASCRPPPDAGADAVLIPDLPTSMREAEPEWDEAAREAGLHLVAIVPPNASDERVARIAGLTSGYTYLLSRVGITGTDHASGTPAERIIRDLERAKAPPTLLGFGISTPGHVRRALEAGAAGVIVGSALVKIVSEHLGDRDAMLKALGSAAASFKAATRTA